MSSPSKNPSSLSSKNPSSLSSNNPFLLPKTKKRSNDFNSESDSDEENPKRFKKDSNEVLTGGDPAFGGVVDGSSLSFNKHSFLSKKRSNDFDSDSDSDEEITKRFKKDSNEVLTGGIDFAVDGVVDGHVMNLKLDDPIDEEIIEAPIAVQEVEHADEDGVEEEINNEAPIPVQEVESDEEVAIPAIHADEDEDDEGLDVDEAMYQTWYHIAEAWNDKREADPEVFDYDTDGSEVSHSYHSPPPSTPSSTPPTTPTPISTSSGSSSSNGSRSDRSE